MPVPLHWHTELLLLLLIVGIGWAYALSTGSLRHLIAPQAPFPLAHAIVFGIALLLGYLTIGSPLDQIGEDFLFFAHMIQHILLVYVVAPLVILGIPPYLQDFLLSKAGIRKLFSFLTHPLVAGTLFTGLYTLWHHPLLYEAALRNKTLHIVEHASMFFPACFMWWCVLSQSTLCPRRPYPFLILYVFLLSLGQTPLFAFLVFSEEVLYPTYAFAPRIFDLTPLDDQLLGGILMKLASMAMTLSVMIVCFTLWYLRDTRDDPVPEPLA